MLLRVVIMIRNVFNMYVRPRYHKGTQLCVADNEADSGHEVVKRITHFRLVLCLGKVLAKREEPFHLPHCEGSSIQLFGSYELVSKMAL